MPKEETPLRTPEQILHAWIEDDLTERAEQGTLPRAFAVAEPLAQIEELLAAGRSPVLTGESGVGKTAIIRELAHRMAAGTGPAVLNGRQILQISIRRRLGALEHPVQLRPQMEALIEVLGNWENTIVPFIRDFHLGWSHDLEPLLASLAAKFPVPILAEGETSVIESMFEYHRELQQHYTPLRVEEPDLDRMKVILDGWAEQESRVHGRRYEPAALDEALHLAHRFLVRDRHPRRTLDLLNQLGGLGTGQAVSAADVIERFCRQHRVPRRLVDPAVPLDLEELEARFRGQVLGQPEAVDAMVNMISLMKARLTDDRRPFGVFLFVGPTGVGKTHVAQLLAEYLFGHRDRLIRFNMADFQTIEAARSLFGDPDDGRPRQMQGLLTQRVVGQPCGVLLLDEFEKANDLVHDRFLQLMDEGCFINGAAQLISCRSMTIIATSNAGSEVYRGSALGFASLDDLSRLDRELDRRLQDHFRLEFLNRFDRIVHFHRLSREDTRTIAKRELELLKNRVGLRQRGLGLEIDEGVLDWLAVHGYDPHYGARFLRRTIERHVSTALAGEIVRTNPPRGAKLALSVRNDRVCAKLLAREKPGGAKPERVAVVGPAQGRAKTMDRETLLAEIARVLSSAESRLAQLEGKKQQSSVLLAKMNERGFWDRSAESLQWLEEYRRLDVAVRIEQRLAKPLRRLAEMHAQLQEQPVELRRLAQQFELACGALAQWEERLAEEGPAAVWLVLGAADALHPAEDAIESLVKIETAWCRQSRLAAGVAAYGLVDEQLARAVLSVEGPGCRGFLAMEEGVHRFCRSQGSDARVLVELIPRSFVPAQTAGQVEPCHSGRGRFGMTPKCQGRLPLPQRGLVLELLGNDRAMLEHLQADLHRAWATSAIKPADVVRTYGEDGVGTRDLRTGAVVPRFRDVRNGRLDRLLEAWRQASK